MCENFLKNVDIYRVIHIDVYELQQMKGDIISLKFHRIHIVKGRKSFVFMVSRVRFGNEKKTIHQSLLRIKQRREVAITTSVQMSVPGLCT